MPDADDMPQPQDRLGQLAVLIVAQLNALYQEPCCAKCCGPCGVVKDLADAGQLDNAIKLGPAHFYEGCDWWVAGGVDRRWLYSRWDCLSNPRCDKGE